MLVAMIIHPPPAPTVDSEAAHKASLLAAEMDTTSLYEINKDKAAVARYLTQASSSDYQTSVMPTFSKNSLSELDLEILDDNVEVVAFTLTEDLKGEQGSENLLPSETGRTFKSHSLEKRDDDRRSEAKGLMSWANKEADDPSSYLAMGYWYTKPTEDKSKAQLGAFVGGAEFASDPSYKLPIESESRLSESKNDVKATYEGTARGYHTSEDDETGIFSASLGLTATFASQRSLTPTKNAVTIKGVIGEWGGIRFDGVASKYELRLGEASLSCALASDVPSNCASDKSIAWSIFNGSTTLWDKTDNTKVDGSTGRWSGLFGKGGGDTDIPAYVGGTAGVTWGDRSLLGAWIGHRQD